MSKDERTQILQLLDQWLEYGDLKDLANKHLKGKHRGSYASKIKRGEVNNPTFLKHCIERAIQRKSVIKSATQRLMA